MAFESQIFWGCLGALFCWVFTWSLISNIVKKHQPYQNRHIDNFASNMEIFAIAPLLPPVLLYALCLRFCADPLRHRFNRGHERRVERRSVVQLRQTSGAQRRIWAADDLESVRREKMPIIYEEHGASETLPASTSITNPSTKGFPFEKLPAELRIHIYGLLDYGTTLRLVRVNRFFSFERPYDSIDKEQRMTFLYYSDSFPHNKGRLACYECIRARPRGDFLVEFRSGDFDRFGAREFERKCFDCAVKNEELDWKRMWRFRFRRWEMGAFYRKALSFSRVKMSNQVQDD